MNKRTDMACELYTGDKSELGEDIIRTDITADEESRRGRYITIESKVVLAGDSDKYERLIGALSGAIRELAGREKNVLVVGLGNPNLTTDALGSYACRRLIVTRHIKDELSKKVPSLCSVVPNVMGVTGIESFDVIKGVVDRVKPTLVIVIDSLASAAVGRIGAAFQVCSTGITPGSGVSNHRMRLDSGSLGCKVISVGVPLVVYATTIIEEAANPRAEYSDELAGLIVTPKDIDMLVSECGKIVAGAINLTFFGKSEYIMP